MNDTLYREQLLDIYKNPSNRGSLKSKSVEISERNVFCGDEITLQLKIEKNKITDVAFDGDACMVAIASSSLVTDELKGKTLKEAKHLTKKDVLDMLGVDLTTSRVKCATLVLESLSLALNKYESN